MEYIPVYILYELAGRFAASASVARREMEKLGGQAGQAPIANREDFLKTFQSAKASPQFVRMVPFAMETIDRIIALLERPDSTLWEFGELVRDLERRIVDELKKQVHFQVHSGLLICLQKTAGWEPVLAKYPKIEHDVSEASLCLAFNRWTASVFHLMRVMECGLDRLCKMAKVKRPSPGWEGLIVSIDKKLAPPPVAGKPPARKTAGKRKKDRFIADAVMLFRAVKEARNTTMHDYTKTYNGQQAVEIYNAVQGFMVKIAEYA